MFSPWSLTSSGEAQLSWLPNLPVATPIPSTESKNGGGDDEQDVMMDSTPTVSAPPPPRKENNEMDYDVAEDESW